MDIKQLTPNQLTLIKGYDTWFVERYSKSEPTIKVDRIENANDNKLLEFRVDCQHPNPVKN